MMKLLQKTAWEKTNQNLSDTPLNLGAELPSILPIFGHGRGNG